MRRGLRITRAVVSVLLFAAALWVLRDVLREYRYHEVVRDLRAIAPLRLVASFGLTVLGYLALIGGWTSDSARVWSRPASRTHS